ERSLLGIDAGGPAGGVVSISGMPAAGKTALAIHAAHRLSDHFPDGQVFCGLNSGAGAPASPDDVVARLLTAAGVAADRIPAGLAGAERVAGNPEAAEQIVRDCGGLPLAIKAAGSRLAATPGMSLDHLGQQLVNHDTRLDLLRYGKLDVRARYHSTYRQLNDRDQAAFRLISLLRQSSFTADEVSPVLGQPSGYAE